MIRLRPERFTRLAALLVALALVTAVSRAGAVYFFCPSMNRVLSSECCHSDEPATGGGSETLATASQPCCEQRTVGAADPGVLARSASDLTAPLVAVVVSQRALPAHRKGSAAHAAVWHSGVDPPRPSPREYRLFLQVFLS